MNFEVSGVCFYVCYIYNMDQIARDFLTKERICVLSVVLSDTSPHGAVVHYSQITDPVKLFIQTSPTVKTKAIQEQGGTAKAAVVVGLSEADFITLQMRGDVRIVADTAELENIYQIHYAKHPKAAKHKGPQTLLLEFVPTWWRYTDLKSHPKIVIEG